MQDVIGGVDVETGEIVAGGNRVAYWREQILDAWRDSVTGIIETGRRLEQSRQELGHGEWGALVAGLPFDHSTVTRLRAIAADERICAHAHNLPASWYSLYELTKLDDETWAAGVEGGVIRPDVKRPEIKKLMRPAFDAPPPVAQSTAAGVYDLILADPPWRYEHVKTESRAIENQYPTMALGEICALPVSEVCADDCVLLMWTTSPKLAESLAVVDAWGFNYRTCAVWTKDRIGMGYWFRQQHELLLVATCGEPRAPEPSERVSSVLTYPRGAHSAKPTELYGTIERMFPAARKLEMFARAPRDGWAAWGNQAHG